MHLLAEAKVLTVERDRRVHVIDDVTDLNSGHRFPWFLESLWDRRNDDRLRFGHLRIAGAQTKGARRGRWYALN